MAKAGSLDSIPVVCASITPASAHTGAPLYLNRSSAPPVAASSIVDSSMGYFCKEIYQR